MNPRYKIWRIHVGCWAVYDPTTEGVHLADSFNGARAKALFLRYRWR